MSLRFMPPKEDTARTFKYLSHVMDESEYMKKLGKVTLITPDKQIKEGIFPDVNLSSTIGGTLSIADVATDKNVIVFFYPGDKEGIKYPELAGCTPEACSFRDAVSELEKLNTQVFGVSFQASERQKKLVEENHLNFALLSDENQLLAKALGLPYWQSKQNEIYPCRQTYILAKGSEIVKVFEKIEPNGHIKDVLDEINKLINLPKLNKE